MPPTTGVRLQSASHGPRSKPSPSERSSTTRARCCEPAELEAAEGLVGGEQHHARRVAHVVGHLLGRAPLLAHGGIQRRGQHQLERRLGLAREPEALDRRVRIVPAVELEQLEAERVVEVHPERAHHPAGKARLQLQVARVERVDARRRRAQRLARQRLRQERRVGGEHEHRSRRSAPATRPSASSSGWEAFTWQCHTTLRPSSHGARPSGAGVVQHDHVVVPLDRLGHPRAGPGVGAPVGLGDRALAAAQAAVERARPPGGARDRRRARATPR